MLEKTKELSKNISAKIGGLFKSFMNMAVSALLKIFNNVAAIGAAVAGVFVVVMLDLFKKWSKQEELQQENASRYDNTNFGNGGTIDQIGVINNNAGKVIEVIKESDTRAKEIKTKIDKVQKNTIDEINLSKKIKNGRTPRASNNRINNTLDTFKKTPSVKKPKAATPVKPTKTGTNVKSTKKINKSLDSFKSGRKNNG